MTKVQLFSLIITAAASINASAQTAYYATPMGLCFAGADENEQFIGDIGFAPANFWLETNAETTGSSFEWIYPTGKNEDTDEETTATSKSQSFQFKMPKGHYSAPVLTAKSGEASQSYAVVNDGIDYGKGYEGNHYSVNYRPAETLDFYQLHSYFATNSSTANSNLDYIFAGMLSDFVLKGFGESFYPSVTFYVEGVNAEVYCPAGLTTDDIEVKLFKKVKTSVKEEELGNFSVESITPVSGKAGRYMVKFVPDGTVTVTDGVMVLLKPTEGSTVQFSPVIPAQTSYHNSNKGTAALWGDFKFYGHQAIEQYWDMFGTEMTEDDDSDQCWLNNWNIGLKVSYDTPTGINEVRPQSGAIEKAATGDGNIYSVTGAKVGRESDFNRLPAGIYIIGGKKVIKK